MSLVPRMATRIERKGLFAKVTITAPDGKRLFTTLHRDVQASDLVVENLKRQMAHLPQVKA